MTVLFVLACGALIGFCAGWLARDVLACRVTSRVTSRGNTIDLTGVHPSPMRSTDDPWRPW